MAARIAGLSTLARLYDVQLAYVNLARERKAAPAESLLLLLQAMGVDVTGPHDVRAALAQRRLAGWQRMLDPVTVAWEGKPPRLELRRLARDEGKAVRCVLTMEDGSARDWSFTPSARSVLRREALDGHTFVAQRMRVDGVLPLGYHRLTVESAGSRAEQTIIAAPQRGYDAPDAAKEWGAFLPLYALRSGKSLGIGDFSDLESLALWLRRMGGSTVATLPLLAAFLDQPYDPSPYSPVSRLFWNECFIDPRAVPGVMENAEARRILESPELAADAERLNATGEVDYRAAWKMRRRILGPVADSFFQSGGTDSAPFREFLRVSPRAEEYARFRSRCERFGAGWREWPEPARARDGASAELDAAARFHLFAQFATNAQLAGVAARVQAAGGRFYLDLPLGVRGDGYDVWRDTGLFALGASAGAPPDPFFSRGQSWGFPPLNPHALRATGYAYFRECIRAHMRFAGVLRLDHVMGLHRLYWIPQGAAASAGVYVRYDAEVQYAILALESHRHETVLVGEDLGTVPQEVRRGMARHRLRRMSVFQYEVAPDRRPPVKRPGRDQVASINTHDMPTFAAFWSAADVADREALGLLDEETAAGVRRERAELRRTVLAFLRERRLLSVGEPAAAEVHGAALRFYCRSPARLVLANLEDLWGETRPHNTPGTFAERPNWRRRAAFGLEEFGAMLAVTDVLRSLNEARRREDG